MVGNKCRNHWSERPPNTTGGGSTQLSSKVLRSRIDQSSTNWIVFLLTVWVILVGALVGEKPIGVECYGFADRYLDVVRESVLQKFRSSLLKG